MCDHNSYIYNILCTSFKFVSESNNYLSNKITNASEQNKETDSLNNTYVCICSLQLEFDIEVNFSTYILLYIITVVIFLNNYCPYAFIISLYFKNYIYEHTQTF